MIHGLSGQLEFDDEGFMNISTFRVRNLVYDGRENVWQDVGCVQGREVRPFGIIWPGDAKSLKSPTEGPVEESRQGCSLRLGTADMGFHVMRVIEIV